MKFLDAEQARLENHDDTLIMKLKSIDQDTSLRRSFGVEILNCPKNDLEICKKVLASIFRRDASKCTTSITESSPRTIVSAPVICLQLRKTID